MNRIKFLSCAATVLTLCAANAAEVKDPAIKLQLDFENNCNATISAGRKTPAEIRGKITYAPGISGQALDVNKNSGCPLYMTSGNLDFDKPGTIVFWFKSQNNWHKNPPSSVTFWGLGNTKGYIGLRIRATGKTPVCPCRRPLTVSIFHSKLRRNVEYTLAAPALTRVCRNWHMAVMAWENNQLYLSYDGAPARAYKLEKPFSNAEFAHSNRFGLGIGPDYLLDDFRIYGRKLSNDELKKLYDEGISKANAVLGK